MSSQTQKGVFFSSKLPNLTEIRDQPIGEPGDNEVLIKNVAVASNPKDWKVPLWMSDWEAVEGNDVAGHIEKVGKDVTEFKKGDKVAAFTIMRKDTKYGAYQEYSVAPAHTTWKVASSTSFEDVATLPLALMTAAIGLFVNLGLTTPSTSGPSPSNKGEIILINGASSSVGIFAVQLAKRAGYSTIGIAGRSGGIATVLGLDRLVDYRGKDTAALANAVKAAARDLGGKIVGTYDAVSEGESGKMLGNAIQPQGGKITTVLPNVESGHENVTIIQTMVGTAHSENADFAAKWYRQIGAWLDDGSFKPNHAKVLPSGLDSVNEGVHLLKDGKVSGEKLVYKIADSKCLA